MQQDQFNPLDVKNCIRDFEFYTWVGNKVIRRTVPIGKPEFLHLIEIMKKDGGLELHLLALALESANEQFLASLNDLRAGKLHF